MFKVGDILIGLPEANGVYTYTRTAIQVQVVSLESGFYGDDMAVMILGEPDSKYPVNSKYFTLYKPKELTGLAKFIRLQEDICLR